VAGAQLHTLAGDPAHPRARWAATRSVAKALGPDLRLAVLAGDSETIARVKRAQQFGPGWVSQILQAVVLSLWRDPDVHALVARANATYAQRREHFLACLARGGVKAHGASGLNVWIPVREEASTLAALMQRGWLVAPGAPYRLAASAPAIRVTTATLGAREAELLVGDLLDVLAPGDFSRSG
jgi:DNA-binding transcriptional MocR family regulator